MALKRQAAAQQNNLWIPTDQVSRSPGHPFYQALNRVLAKKEFDRFVEDL